MAMNFQDNNAPQQPPSSSSSDQHHLLSTNDQLNLSEQRLISSRIIVSVNPYDILCGRGKTAFTHPGNRRFRDTVASVVDEYNAAGSRLGKSMVVTRIVQGIRAEGGRFLKLDRSTHRYYELDDKQAKEKVHCYIYIIWSFVLFLAAIDSYFLLKKCFSFFVLLRSVMLLGMLHL